MDFLKQLGSRGKLKTSSSPPLAAEEPVLDRRWEIGPGEMPEGRPEDDLESFMQTYDVEKAAVAQLLYDDYKQLRPKMKALYNKLDDSDTRRLLTRPSRELVVLNPDIVIVLLSKLQEVQLPGAGLIGIGIDTYGVEVVSAPIVDWLGKVSQVLDAPDFWKGAAKLGGSKAGLDDDVLVPPSSAQGPQRSSSVNIRGSHDHSHNHLLVSVSGPLPTKEYGMVDSPPLQVSPDHQKSSWQISDSQSSVGAKLSHPEVHLDHSTSSSKPPSPGQNDITLPVVPGATKTAAPGLSGPGPNSSPSSHLRQPSGSGAHLMHSKSLPLFETADRQDPWSSSSDNLSSNKDTHPQSNVDLKDHHHEQVLLGKELPADVSTTSGLAHHFPSYTSSEVLSVHAAAGERDAQAAGEERDDDAHDEQILEEPSIISERLRMQGQPSPSPSERGARAVEAAEVSAQADTERGKGRGEEEEEKEERSEPNSAVMSACTAGSIEKPLESLLESPSSLESSSSVVNVSGDAAPSDEQQNSIIGDLQKGKPEGKKKKRRKKKGGKGGSQSFDITEHDGDVEMLDGNRGEDMAMEKTEEKGQNQESELAEEMKRKEQNERTTTTTIMDVMDVDSLKLDDDRRMEGGGSEMTGVSNITDIGNSEEVMDTCARKSDSEQSATSQRSREQKKKNGDSEKKDEARHGQEMETNAGKMPLGERLMEEEVGGGRKENEQGGEVTQVDLEKKKRKRKEKEKRRRERRKQTQEQERELQGKYNTQAAIDVGNPQLEEEAGIEDVRQGEKEASMKDEDSGSDTESGNSSLAQSTTTDVSEPTGVAALTPECLEQLGVDGSLSWGEMVNSLVTTSGVDKGKQKADNEEENEGKNEGTSEGRDKGNSKGKDEGETVHSNAVAESGLPSSGHGAVLTLPDGHTDSGSSVKDYKKEETSRGPYSSTELAEASVILVSDSDHSGRLSSIEGSGPLSQESSHPASGQRSKQKETGFWSFLRKSKKKTNRSTAASSAAEAGAAVPVSAAGGLASLLDTGAARPGEQFEVEDSRPVLSGSEPVSQELPIDRIVDGGSVASAGVTPLVPMTSAMSDSSAQANRGNGSRDNEEQTGGANEGSNVRQAPTGSLNPFIVDVTSEGLGKDLAVLTTSTGVSCEKESSSCISDGDRGAKGADGDGNIRRLDYQANDDRERSIPQDQASADEIAEDDVRAGGALQVLTSALVFNTIDDVSQDNSGTTSDGKPSGLVSSLSTNATTPAESQSHLLEISDKSGPFDLGITGRSGTTGVTATESKAADKDKEVFDNHDVESASVEEMTSSWSQEASLGPYGQVPGDLSVERKPSGHLEFVPVLAVTSPTTDLSDTTYSSSPQDPDDLDKDDKQSYPFKEAIGNPSAGDEHSGKVSNDVYDVYLGDIDETSISVSTSSSTQLSGDRLLDGQTSDASTHTHAQRILAVKNEPGVLVEPAKLGLAIPPNNGETSESSDHYLYEHKGASLSPDPECQDGQLPEAGPVDSTHQPTAFFGNTPGQAHRSDPSVQIIAGRDKKSVNPFVGIDTAKGTPPPTVTMNDKEAMTEYEMAPALKVVPLEDSRPLDKTVDGKSISGVDPISELQPKDSPRVPIEPILPGQTAIAKDSLHLTEVTDSVKTNKKPYPDVNDGDISPSATSEAHGDINAQTLSESGIGNEHNYRPAKDQESASPASDGRIPTPAAAVQLSDPAPTQMIVVDSVTRSTGGPVISDLGPRRGGFSEIEEVTDYLQRDSYNPTVLQIGVINKPEMDSNEGKGDNTSSISDADTGAGTDKALIAESNVHVLPSIAGVGGGTSSMVASRPPVQTDSKSDTAAEGKKNTWWRKLTKAVIRVGSSEAQPPIALQGKAQSGIQTRENDTPDMASARGEGDRKQFEGEAVTKRSVGDIFLNQSVKPHAEESDRQDVVDAAPEGKEERQLGETSTAKEESNNGKFPNEEITTVYNATVADGPEAGKATQSGASSASHEDISQRKNYVSVLDVPTLSTSGAVEQLQQQEESIGGPHGVAQVRHDNDPHELRKSNSTDSANMSTYFVGADLELHDEDSASWLYKPDTPEFKTSLKMPLPTESARKGDTEESDTDRYEDARDMADDWSSSGAMSPPTIEHKLMDGFTIQSPDSARGMFSGEFFEDIYPDIFPATNRVPVSELALEDLDDGSVDPTAAKSATPGALRRLESESTGSGDAVQSTNEPDMINKTTTPGPNSALKGSVEAKSFDSSLDDPWNGESRLPREHTGPYHVQGDEESSGSHLNTSADRLRADGRGDSSTSDNFAAADGVQDVASTKLKVVAMEDDSRLQSSSATSSGKSDAKAMLSSSVGASDKADDAGGKYDSDVEDDTDEPALPLSFTSATVPFRQSDVALDQIETESAVHKQQHHPYDDIWSASADVDGERGSGNSFGIKVSDVPRPLQGESPPPVASKTNEVASSHAEDVEKKGSLVKGTMSFVKLGEGSPLSHEDATEEDDAILDLFLGSAEEDDFLLGHIDETRTTTPVKEDGGSVFEPSRSVILPLAAVSSSPVSPSSTAAQDAGKGSAPADVAKEDTASSESSKAEQKPKSMLPFALPSWVLGFGSGSSDTVSDPKKVQPENVEQYITSGTDLHVDIATPSNMGSRQPTMGKANVAAPEASAEAPALLNKEPSPATASNSPGDKRGEPAVDFEESSIIDLFLVTTSSDLVPPPSQAGDGSTAERSETARGTEKKETLPSPAQSASAFVAGFPLHFHDEQFRVDAGAESAEEVSSKLGERDPYTAFAPATTPVTASHPLHSPVSQISTASPLEGAAASRDSRDALMPKEKPDATTEALQDEDKHVALDGSQDAAVALPGVELLLAEPNTKSTSYFGGGGEPETRVIGVPATSTLQDHDAPSYSGGDMDGPVVHDQSAAVPISTTEQENLMAFDAGERMPVTAMAAVVSTAAGPLVEPVATQVQESDKALTRPGAEGTAQERRRTGNLKAADVGTTSLVPESQAQVKKDAYTVASSTNVTDSTEPEADDDDGSDILQSARVSFELDPSPGPSSMGSPDWFALTGSNNNSIHGGARFVSTQDGTGKEKPTAHGFSATQSFKLANEGGEISAISASEFVALEQSMKGTDRRRPMVIVGESFKDWKVTRTEEGDVSSSEKWEEMTKVDENPKADAGDSEALQDSSAQGNGAGLHVKDASQPEGKAAATSSNLEGERDGSFPGFHRRSGTMGGDDDEHEPSPPTSTQGLTPDAGARHKRPAAGENDHPGFGSLVTDEAVAGKDPNETPLTPWKVFESQRLNAAPGLNEKVVLGSTLGSTDSSTDPNLRGTAGRPTGDLDTFANKIESSNKASSTAAIPAKKATIVTPTGADYERERLGTSVPPPAGKFDPTQSVSSATSEKSSPALTPEQSPISQNSSLMPSWIRPHNHAHATQYKDISNERSNSVSERFSRKRFKNSPSKRFMCCSSPKVKD